MSHDELIPLAALKSVLGKTSKQMIRWLDDHRIAIHNTRQHGQMIARDALKAKPKLLEQVDKAVAELRGVKA